MTNRPAIVVVNIHSGDNSRAVFGPFVSGEEASNWGFKNFPKNTASTGDSVTWCWEYLGAPDCNVHDFVASSIN